jgi:predicted enzyme related to lactoylglutathione lyase
MRFRTGAAWRRQAGGVVIFPVGHVTGDHGMSSKNRIVHVEWRTQDTERLKGFYGSLFDWKFKPAAPNYAIVETGSAELKGGIFQMDVGSPLPVGVSNYIEVDELAPYEEKVKSLGGQILLSNQEVPGWGWFSIFTDVDHNVMALWRASPDEKAAKKAAKKARKAAKKDKKGKKKSKKK